MHRIRIRISSDQEGGIRERKMGQLGDERIFGGPLEPIGGIIGGGMVVGPIVTSLLFKIFPVFGLLVTFQLVATTV